MYMILGSLLLWRFATFHFWDTVVTGGGKGGGELMRILRPQTDIDEVKLV
jgi:hypothetical protein